MFAFPSNNNRRFKGTVTVKVGNRKFVIDASSFSLEEGGTRHIGDGDSQYEELWIGHPPPGCDETPVDGQEGAPFEAVHVYVVRLNEGPYQFQGDPKVINPDENFVRVQDNLEFVEPDKEGPQVDE